jgi:imidazolonepropionase-like amidohydrolase
MAVGSRADTNVPAEAEVIDVSRFCLLPGLLDAHLHIGAGRNIYQIPPLFLSHGVTTARDPGRPIEVYLPMRSMAESMPRTFVTGPHFDQSPPAWPANAVVLSGPDEAREAVDRYVQQGASGIKVYFRLSLESIQATCEQADKHRIPVTAHLELVNASDAIRAGLDGIEHITSFGTDLATPEEAALFREEVFADNEARHDGRYRLWASLNFDTPQTTALLDLLRERRVFVSPTLATFERRPGDRNTTDVHVEGFRKMLQFTGMCHKAGVPVVTGSHTWAPHADFGWAYQREMELLIESGMTPMEVIQASTIRNAEFFGCAERLGTIEPGKLADLVLVKGAPFENIKDMYNLSAVMLNGKFVQRTGLDEQ